jgi:hypothetical protein
MNRREKFKILFKELIYKTQMMSSISMMIIMPEYHQILKLGNKEELVELLMHQLFVKPQIIIFKLLHEVTGENPVPKEYAGKIKEMTRFWIHWNYGMEYQPHSETKVD